RIVGARAEAEQPLLLDQRLEDGNPPLVRQVLARRAGEAVAWVPPAQRALPDVNDLDAELLGQRVVGVDVFLALALEPGLPLGEKIPDGHGHPHLSQRPRRLSVRPPFGLYPPSSTSVQRHGFAPAEWGAVPRESTLS